MMFLKVYAQDSCPRCPQAKALAKHLELTQSVIKVEYYDVKTDEGLADALENDVMTTPSLVLFNNRGRLIKSWHGLTPSLPEFMTYIGKYNELLGKND